MLVYGNLIAEIAKRGYTKNELANYLGMSRNTFANKLIGKSDFTQTQFDSLREKFFPDMEGKYLNQKYQRPNSRHSA